MRRVWLLLGLAMALEASLFLGWMARRLGVVWGRMDALELRVRDMDAVYSPVEGEQ